MSIKTGRTHRFAPTDPKNNTPLPFPWGGKGKYWWENFRPYKYQERSFELRTIHKKLDSSLRSE